MKITVLGNGSIGSRHACNLTKLGHGVSTWDIKEQNPDSRRDVIESADAVIIATPTSNHFNDIMEVTLANKPMFVEKPVVSTLQELSSVPTQNIRMVGYNLRFHSCVILARELLGAGKVGRPLWARFTCAQYNDKPAYLRDGVIMNWSHEVDLAMYLLGDATYMSGSSFKPFGEDKDAGEDVADLILFHEWARCQSAIHLDYLTKPERRGFLIVGTDGAIECDLVSRVLFVRDRNGKIERIHNGKDTFDENYLDEMKAFIDRLNGKVTVGCDVDDAMAVANICLTAKGDLHDH